MAFETKQSPQAEWLASYEGFRVYCDPDIPEGTVEFRDQNGKTIGWIVNAKEIRIGAVRAAGQT